MTGAGSCPPARWGETMQIRKVDPDEAAGWEAPEGPPRQPTPAELAALVGELADARGITRIDRPGPAGGEHAWRGRVYTRGVELHRQFADSAYDGPVGALDAAVSWRNAMRALAGARPAQRGNTPRIVRAEYARTCGWLAYAPHARRYFADSAHGGYEAARATASAWLAGHMEGVEE